MIHLPTLRRVVFGAFVRRPRGRPSRCPRPRWPCGVSSGSLAPAPSRGARRGALAALAAGPGLQRGEPRLGARLRAPRHRASSPPKGLLLVAALYVTANTLGGAPRTATGSSLPSSSWSTVAAIVGLAQTIACPGPAADYGPPRLALPPVLSGPRLLQHRHDAGGRAEPGPARHPASPPAGGSRSRAGRPCPGWSRSPGLLGTYTRGAWMGFAAGVLALLPMAAARGDGSCLAVSSCSGSPRWPVPPSCGSDPVHGRSPLIPDGDGACLHVAQRAGDARPGIPCSGWGRGSQA